MNFQRFAEAVRLGTPLEAAVDMGYYWKGDSGKQKGTSTTTSKPVQSAQYNNLLNKSDSWLNSGGLDKSYGGSADFDPVADMTQGQKDAIGGMTQTGNSLQQLYNGQGMQGLANSLGTYDPSKTGLQGAIDASNNQLDWNYATQVAPSVRQGAVSTGQYGSSRSGIAEGIAQSQLSQQKVNSASQLAYQDQQAFNQNQANTLANLANISKGLGSGDGLSYDAGALQQNQNQAEIAGQLEKWAYENNADLNDLLAYKQLISGDMGGTNTTKSTMSGGGGGSGWTSMLSSIGGQFAGNYAGAAGGRMGGGAGILGGG